MRQTVLRRIAFALLVLLALDWAPGLPPFPMHSLAQVRAQGVFPIIGPSGTMVFSNASVTAVNTANEVSMFQYLIPSAYVATASAVGNTATQVFTGGNPSGTSTTGGGISPVGALSNTPQPLHFRAVGNIAGAGATSISIGVNLNDGIAAPSGGGAVASVNVSNNLTATTLTPAKLDVWIVPIATGTATPNAVNNAFLMARFAYQATTIGSEVVVNSAVVAGVNWASPTRLNVLARWSAAASGSSLTFFSRLLKIGE